jgi:hypothetical protein
MALHACINGVVVVDIVDIINEDQYRSFSSIYSSVIDITPFILKPQLGWILQGVTFAPPENQQVSISKLIGDRIRYYQSLAPDILVDMYIQNTLAGITAQQSSDMFTEYGDILHCIREGAWPTALYKLNEKQPDGFVTQEMIDSWIDLIQRNLV